jgi:hypothetical protein
MPRAWALSENKVTAQASAFLTTKTPSLVYKRVTKLHKAKSRIFLVFLRVFAFVVKK